MDIGFLRVETASKRKQFGRVIDTMRNDWGLGDQGTKLIPDIGVLLGKTALKAMLNGGFCLLNSLPARGMPQFMVY